MESFDDFKIKKQLRNALRELSFEKPTPIQAESFSPIMSGADFMGIAQTGTGKTLAYLLPILQDLNYSEQSNPRVLILAPTRELVIQIVQQIEKLTEYMSVRVAGVYGGSSNMKRQQAQVAEGLDIIVGTPRRLYDLVLTNLLRLNGIKKVVVDEVDILLDFGFKTQLNNIGEHLPRNRQNILFSATMSDNVEELIKEFMVNPVKVQLALSGTPIDTITQKAYAVPNFYTKANLVNHLLQDREIHSKVLLFVATRIQADRLVELLDFGPEMGVIHAGKEQNNRTGTIEAFVAGETRILITTDVIARGIDIEDVSTVISFDVPNYPENYIHRIGRTGRAGKEGLAILLHTPKEAENKQAIEELMNLQIESVKMPAEVEYNPQLAPEEKDKPIEHVELHEKNDLPEVGASFHEKSAKNSKTKKEKVSYEKKLKARYKKPIRKGDKIQNLKAKKRKKK